MKAAMILPNPASILRAIVTAAGFRPAFEEKGLGKDLDDMASDKRPSSTCDLIGAIEELCYKLLCEECGGEWADLLHTAWSQSRNAMQHLSRHVNTCPLEDEQGRALVVDLFQVPMLASLLHMVESRYPGPIDQGWWQSPFDGWLRWAANRTRSSVDQLMVHIADPDKGLEDRTIQRWRNGERIERIRSPYRPTVLQMLREKIGGRVNESDVDVLTGWLIVSVSVQSLSKVRRKDIQIYFQANNHMRWDFHQAIHEITKNIAFIGMAQILSIGDRSYDCLSRLVCKQKIGGSVDPEELRFLEGLIDSQSGPIVRQYKCYYSWFSARSAAMANDQNAALGHYADAVHATLWCGGPDQVAIVREALVYAAGIGNKVDTEEYWDRTFLIGMNKWPKRPLDHQEMRRLSLGFEAIFEGKLAKDRVPPKLELILTKSSFQVSRDELANPNRRVKRADGRTRRTPLMEAVLRGELENVKQLLAKGGDPNDFIPESGEGPFSFALRRAVERRDAKILEHFLGLELTHDTVNRSFSTSRDTPLQMAIALANSTVVDRLVDLGAKIEAVCGGWPSALCYAMQVLRFAFEPEDGSLERAYLEVRGIPDVNDAKAGAVTDADAAVHRRQVWASMDSTPENRAIYDGIKAYYRRPVEDCRQVIKLLLQRGANANRRYPGHGGGNDRWAPTLYAAEIGDLDILKALIEAGGDPEAALEASHPLARRDALWIATQYKHEAIISFLERKSGGV